jgi:hypothetical protein
VLLHDPAVAGGVMLDCDDWVVARRDGGIFLVAAAPSHLEHMEMDYEAAGPAIRAVP